MEIGARLQHLRLLSPDAERLLEEIVRLSNVYPAAPESRRPLDAEIA